MASAEQVRILEFWRAIEMLNPGEIPKLASRDVDPAERLVFDLDTKDVTPWSAGHPVAAADLKPGWTWRFTVYGGLFEVESIRTTLESFFGADDDTDEKQVPGQTALFAFTVDVAGFLVENSATLSSSAWALGRLRRSGSVPHNWLDGFGAEERTFARALNRLTPTSNDTTSTTGLGNAERNIGDHAKGAGVEAVRAGAKATGAAVTVAAAAAVTVAAGPVLGGILGAVAGTFVEKLLTAKSKNNAATADHDTGRPPTGDLSTRLPDFVLTAAALHTFVAGVADALGVADRLSPRGVRIKCVRVPAKKTKDSSEQPFLNSFIADDLATVARGHVGASLARYLTDSDALSGHGRVDVREQEHEHMVIDGVSPGQQPSGRWPGDISKPLVLSQQFAVDKIIAELGQDVGVFAVNGPPGTGKTTLLRDVIAAVVVDRARTLANLSQPADAFTAVIEKVEITEQYYAAVHGLRSTVTGSEILVATKGNTAAANVTAEIPGMDALGDTDEEYGDAARRQGIDADYFPALASQVLGTPAWGLLAATLGNRQNCKDFVERFWWGKAALPETDPTTGMKEILRDARNDPEGVADWSTVVSRFRAAEAEVSRLSAERDGVAAALRVRPQWMRHLAELEKRRRERTHSRSAVQGVAAEARRNHAAAQVALDAATAAYREHRADKPGFWVSLSTWFRAGREWDVEHQRRKAAHELADTTHRNRRADLDRLTDECVVINDEINNQIAQRNNAQRTLSAISATLATAQGRWGDCVPDPAAYAADRGDAIQLSTPWADDAFTTARNRVTLEALRVHKAFVLGAAKQLNGNLRVAVAILDGSPKISDDALRAAWRTLFLVVPVISTTFASLPRLFGRFGPESLGWLLIDEAGQATPQEAVGGMWRARRTVVVGDPQQLEPIVSLPVPAQRSLLRHYAVAEEWLPSATSVQRVADRLNTYGTNLDDPIEDGTTWVGAPLRVHRRCDRLMFDVANKIAYGGTLMVFGTPLRPPYPGDDEWIDVSTSRAKGNWVPTEGEALARLLDDITRAGVHPPDIRIISPFRDVVSGAKSVAETRFGKKFAAENVGTINTVQGQEANVVIIVLGSAPERARAREWAAEKPNLLNVAVSRARRRLYVIGDRSRWEHQRHFSVLAAALPRDTSGR